MNNVVLVGRLCADPELRYTPNATAVASMRIAVDRPGGKGPEKQTDYIPCVAWRQSAEFASNYLRKGRLVAVEGQLNIDEFQDSSGSKRREAKIVVSRIQALDRGQDQDQPQSKFVKQPNTQAIDMDDIADPFGE